jgi:MFS family permease
LLGIGVATSIPAYDALYSRFLSKGQKATEWGAWEGVKMIAAAIAALVGGFLATYYGFKILFLVMFLLSVIGVILSKRFPSKKF